MKETLIVAALWLIAIVTTVIFIRETGWFTYLGPVYLICMIGSIITVRRARER
jgi:hypothetical protein